MAFVGLFPFVILAIPQYHFAEKAIVQYEESYLQTVLREHSTHLQEWLTNTRKNLIFASKSNCVQGLCSGACPTKLAQQDCPFLDAILKSHTSYRGIVVLNQDWSIISRVGAAGLCGENIPSPSLKELAVQSKDFVIAPDYCYEDGHTILEVGQPINNPGSNGDTTSSYVVASLDLSKAITSLIEDQSHRDSEKIYIISQDGQYVLPPIGHHELWRKESTFKEGLAGTSPGRVGIYEDYRGVPVLGAYTSVPNTDWLLVAEIDKDVSFHWLNTLTFRTGLVGLLTLAVVIAVSLFISKKLSFPLQQLAAAARGVSAKDNSVRVPQFEDSEMREVGDAFNRMVEKLEISQRELERAASLAAIGELSSSIVHEMRGPLSSIKMNLQALDRKMQPDHICQEMAEIALNQSKRLEHMLEDLQHYGKPLELHREEITFEQLVKEVMSFLSSKADEKNLSLQVDDGLGGEQLLVDKEQMIRVFSNLVSNAIEWSPPGGTVKIKGLKHTEEIDWVFISVSDDGPGIRPSHLQKIFTAFFTTREEGTGLGLANAKKIVEYHGGSIIGENREDGGATFSIKLPLEKVMS